MTVRLDEAADRDPEVLAARKHLKVQIEQYTDILTELALFACHQSELISCVDGRNLTAVDISRTILRLSTDLNQAGAKLGISQAAFKLDAALRKSNATERRIITNSLG